MSQAVSESLVIADYDPRWPQMFRAERTRILKAIGEWIVAIEHFGSTAVPGLAAKPVIDIYAGLRSWDDREQCLAPLEALGYEYRGEDPVIGQIFVKLTNDPLPGQTYRGSDGRIRSRTHNVHLLPRSHPEWERHLLFRDYLRKDASAASKYAALKRSLAQVHGLDINAYTNAKSVFIEDVIERARTDTPPDIYLADYDARWRTPATPTTPLSAGWPSGTRETSRRTRWRKASSCSTSSRALEPPPLLQAPLRLPRRGARRLIDKAYNPEGAD